MGTIKLSERQKCTKLIYHLSYEHQACPVQYFLLFHSLILFMKCTGRNFNVILLFKYSDTVIIIKCLKLLNYSLFHFLYLSVLKMQKIQFLWKNFSWSHTIWSDDVRQRHIGVEFQVDESNRSPMPFWVWIYFQLEIQRSGSREIDLKRKWYFDKKSISKIFSIEIFYWL